MRRMCPALLVLSFSSFLWAEEVSFTYQVGKSPQTVSVGEFQIEQSMTGGMDIKNTPHGYIQFERFELRIGEKSEGMSKAQSIEFDQDELDEGIIKTITFKTKRFQVRLENIAKMDNPNAKKRRHPKYVVKSITYRVIIKNT